MNKAATVDEYILTAPKEIQPKLVQLRAIIREAAPKAEEKISYGMPYYGYGGRLAYFSCAKHHIGLFIMPKVLADFEREVAEYRTGKATLRLSFDKPLPVSLIRKLIMAGAKKNKAGL